MNLQFFLDTLLSQNKKKEIVIILQDSIEKTLQESFANILSNSNHRIIYYTVDSELLNLFENSNENIFVLLTKDLTLILKTKNDDRIFLFSIKKSLKLNNKDSSLACIDVNYNFSSFILLKCCINYKSLSELTNLGISSYHGFGLFSNQTIPKGTVLFKLYGNINDIDAIKIKNFHGEWNALKNGKFLIRNERTSYGLMNHSKKPNCYIDEKMNIVTNQAVQQNEELLLNYLEEELPEAYLNGWGKTYL